MFAIRTITRVFRPTTIAANLSKGVSPMFTRRTPYPVPRSVLLASIACMALQAWPGSLAAETRRAIVVTTTAELEAAMVPENAGKKIQVKAGVYDLNNALTVPERATVVGDGVMTFDDAGLPAGFKPNGRTLLRSTAALAGDILTLGDGSRLSGLAIEDSLGRTGNPVVVVSRSAGDVISAKIEECEIINPNPTGIAPPGPTGRALVVMSRNPNLGQDPPPHDNAALSLRLIDSIVRSSGGGWGVFAINFASDSEISLVLRNDVIGGGLGAAGGVSRPDAVSGSRVDIESRHCLYRSDTASPTPLGWNLVGGTTAPLPGLVSQASTDNSLRMHSRDDRIEGFDTAIAALGAQRVVPLPEPSSGNETELKLRGARLQSVTSDLTLYGAASYVDGVSPGDDNVLRVKIRQSTGSGPRANAYFDSWSPTTGALGEGNEFRMVGSLPAFQNSNSDFDPAPPAEFFE